MDFEEAYRGVTPCRNFVHTIRVEALVAISKKSESIWRMTLAERVIAPFQSLRDMTNFACVLQFSSPGFILKTKVPLLA